MKLSSIRGYGKPTLIPGSEFSEALAERLCAEAMDTPSITQVANRVGIRVTTLYSWLRKGRDGDPRFQQFAAEFARARACHEDRWLGNIEDIAKDDNPKVANARLRANEFMLRHHFRSTYTEQAAAINTTIGTQTNNLNLKVLSTEQARGLRAMLEAVVRDEDGDHDEAQKLLADIPVIDVEPG